MQDVQTMLAQAKSYRAAAAEAPNRRIYELLLELAAEFQNVAVKADATKSGGAAPGASRL